LISRYSGSKWAKGIKVESVMIESHVPRTSCWLLALLSLLVPVPGEGSGGQLRVSAAQEQAEETKERDPQGRRLTHAETLRWATEHKAWRRARKTTPIWARAVEAAEIGTEFQTADHAVEKARAGYWLCVGVAGEPWFQTLEKIEGKYEPQDEVLKMFEFGCKPRNYRIFKPKATARNWVAQVKGVGIAGFFVRPSYNLEHPLYSPAGGYVVRDDVKDPNQAKPGDVWLVQEVLFESTYEVIP
jgi:hypothetical protein